MNWARLLELAHAEVARTLADLPPDLRARAEALPITYERVPNRAMMQEGVEADTQGLFVGGDFAHEEHVPLPAQIILFLENIRDLAQDDEAEFRKEVRI